MSDLAIRTTNLTKSYGRTTGRKTSRTTVLDGIDLSVAAGEVFALLGPNGAGKTTTVNILSTLQHPDGGSAEIFGLDVVSQAGAVRPLIGLTGQFSLSTGCSRGGRISRSSPLSLICRNRNSEHGSRSCSSASTSARPQRNRSRRIRVGCEGDSTWR